MGVRIVLIASALTLGPVLLALTPAGFLIAPLDQGIWRHATLASYLTLNALSPWVAPLAAAVGTSAAYAVQGVLSAAGLAVATVAGLRLAADVGGVARASWLFLFVWSLGLPLIVLLAMEQWMCIA